MADGNNVDQAQDTTVQGAPLARVSSRLSWPLQASKIREREGETVIRTPSGPQQLTTLLDNVSITYFESRQEFETAIREVAGTGPVPTDEDSQPQNR